ncbi:ras-related protein Rap-2c-like [Haliotis rubra]|uniref:ras-related protein Rap-2c-like n=1 Tax=Haliotis rubra TaxID=36100 RepID=UPI001EE5C071|nr:ras-related protein Rap-2c-like [Haliotis rubra]
MPPFTRPIYLGGSSTFSSSNPGTDNSFKLAVMGASSVGKSDIINKFINGTSPKCYWPTVQERYTKDMDVDGRHVVLDIFDTPGGYCFSYLRELAIVNADAFVLVYSVEDAVSFETVTLLRNLIAQQKPTGVPVLVVGNKADVTTTSRFMSKKKAHSMVTSVWQDDYMEISARDDSNISDIFTSVVIKACSVPSKPRRLTAPGALVSFKRRFSRLFKSDRQRRSPNKVQQVMYS